jgi:hypothetical protein
MNRENCRKDIALEEGYKWQKNIVGNMKEN